MEKIQRKWRIGAAVLAVALATSAATRPSSPDFRAAPLSAKDVLTLSVAITPTHAVPAHVQCIWTATPSGGTAPYHYAWAVNNSAIGTDSPNLAYTNGGSGFRIQVFVTDATAAQANDSKIITIGGSC